jgi:hypothetical protein
MHNNFPEPPAASRADVAGAPVISVVRGQPTEEELAAVVTVLMSRAAPASGSAAAPAPGSRSRWSDRARLLREPVFAAPGAWRASALPR